MVNIQVKHENILSEYFDGKYSGETLKQPESKYSGETLINPDGEYSTKT